MRRRAPLVLGLAALLLLPACRGRSIEFVGKAGKSLGAHQDALASVSVQCELQSGRELCRQQIVGPWGNGNTYATDRMIADSLAMLATYGAALEKLSGKKSAGTSEFAGGALTLNGATKWVDLGDKGPDAIKAGVKLLDKLIAGGVQRKVLAAEYEQLGTTMSEIETSYRAILKGELLYVCQVDEAIAQQLENLELDVYDGLADPDSSFRQLGLTSGRDARARLRAERWRLYEAADSLALFFAAHAMLGELLQSNKSDTDVLAAMKQAGKAAQAEWKAELEAFERAKGCPYGGDPSKPTEASVP